MTFGMLVGVKTCGKCSIEKTTANEVRNLTESKEVMP